MKDVVAGQFLGSGYHLFSTDDTHIVRGLQVLRSCIWVECVHVANGSSRHYGIRYSLLKLPHREIHGSNGKQGEGVHFDHYGHERHVQQHLKKACKELCVKHVDSFIFPRVLALEVNGVQDIFDEGGENHGHQYRVLKSEDQLYRGSSGDDAVAGMIDE